MMISMARWILLAATAALLLSEEGAVIECRVIDGRGQPSAGATVELKLESQTVTAKTDANGIYRFLALPATSYHLRAASGPAEARTGPFTLQPNETKRIELTLHSGSELAPQPEFFDQPNFIVAGVADSTNRGGHGSDAILRSSETLAKDTASLSKAAAPTPVSEKSLRDALAREPAKAELHHSLAHLEETRANSLDAVREYQRAAELDASERNLFDWGAELLAHRTFEPAVEVYSKGARLFPNSTRMLLGLAVAYYATGSYEQAAKRFFEATDLAPADPRPYLFLAKTQTSSIAESEGYLERMSRFAQLHPDDASANYYYAVAVWKQKKAAEEAQRMLEKAIRLDPTFAAAYLQGGLILAAQSNFSAAAKAYEKALVIDPRLEEAHYRLAQAYVHLGEKQKAQNAFATHDRLTKETAAKVERERREVQQFVIELRKPSQ